MKTSLDQLETKEPPAEAKNLGLLTIEDVVPYFTLEQKEQLLQKYEV